jgi:hypothetical protein
MRRTLALFVVGALTLFLFEATFTLAAGVLLLVASIVSGVFAVADPEFLAEGDGD